MYDPIAFCNDNAYNNNFCLFRSVHEEKIEDIKGVIGHRISMYLLELPHQLVEKNNKCSVCIAQTVSSVSILCYSLLV